MSLDKLRRDIDRIDNAIIDLLAQRKAVALLVAQEKARTGQALLQKARYEHMLAERVTAAEKYGLPGRFIKKMWHVIHEESLRQQKEDA